MIKTKIDSVPEKELQIKQLEISLEKQKKLVKKMQEESYLRKFRNKHHQSKTTHKTTKT